MFDSAFELMDNINDFVSIFIGNATEILDCVNEELDAFIKYLA